MCHGSIYGKYFKKHLYIVKCMCQTLMTSFPSILYPLQKYLWLHQFSGHLYAVIEIISKHFCTRQKISMGKTEFLRITSCLYYTIYQKIKLFAWYILVDFCFSRLFKENIWKYICIRFPIDFKSHTFFFIKCIFYPLQIQKLFPILLSR